MSEIAEPGANAGNHFYHKMEYYRIRLAEVERERDELRKAMCIFMREELGDMIFETDDEVVKWFLDYAVENE